HVSLYLPALSSFPTRRSSDLELEAKVARLERDKQCANGASWLDEWFGVFKDSPAFEEAVRYGREWRESFGYDDLTEEDVVGADRSEVHTSELQSLTHLVCRLL